MAKMTTGGEHAYSQHFSDEKICAGYHEKFSGVLDRVRSALEVGVLEKHAKGRLFDCSIATGRFIEELRAVDSYSGMDYSPHFVAYIRQNFPAVDVSEGDLLKGIRQADDCFDTVICLRTLFALGDPAPILYEMLRITRPGGSVLFDYGITTRPTRVDGKRLETSIADIPSVLDRLGVERWMVVRLDGLAVKLKGSRLLSPLLRVFGGWEATYRLLFLVEQLSLRLGMRDRLLYIVKKEDVKAVSSEVPV